MSSKCGRQDGHGMNSKVDSMSDGMEKVVGDLLRQNGHTLATAESCTGGLIASRITDVPGSSEYFFEGVIVYSNQAKKNLLGVREETLRDFGAVSEQTVREMCAGIRKLSGADLTLAISGIAGPGGGSADEPVGLVYIGLYDGYSFFLEELRLQGSRKQIKFQASQSALDLVRRYYQGDCQSNSQG
ncbi:MAG: CinA family protein [bacterium]